MTWLQFKERVKVFCTVDAVRLNTSDLFDQLTRQAVIDLQANVEQMRFPHETNYMPATNLTESGFASVGSLPDQARLRDAYLVKDDVEDEQNSCARGPLRHYPWANRYDLICGNPRITNCQYYISISPQATTFIVFPKVEIGRHVQLFWEGIKVDEFEDAGTVPFGERAAMAAAMFVKACIVREVDKDPALADAYMGRDAKKPGTYLNLRAQVYLDEKDRTRFVDDQDSPQAQDDCANTTCVPCCAPA